MPNHQQAALELLKSVEELLILPDQAGLVKPVTDRIAELCSIISGISSEDDMNRWHDVDSANGVAISPVQAAKCTKEMLRTQVFIKGIKDALIDQAKVKKKVHVLYAGTGPFGILLLPLAALLSDKTLCVTLIDIHQENIDAIHKMIDALNIRDSIQGVHCADACTWDNPDHIEFDLIVSETMNTLLRREPQIAIFCHLQQFLASSGSLIPEQIKLDAWGLNRDTSEATDKGKKHHLTTFFRLNRATSNTLAKNKYPDNTPKIAGTFQIPTSSTPFDTLMLSTDIQVYADHWLKENQSSLNIPIFLKNLDIKPGDKIAYQYQLQPIAEFKFDVPRYRPDSNLAAFDKTGNLGIFHLKRFWQKTQLDIFNDLDKQLQQREWPLDDLLIRKLGGSHQQWLSYSYQPRLKFDDFERWVEQHSPKLDSCQLDQLNQHLEECHHGLE